MVSPSGCCKIQLQFMKPLWLTHHPFTYIFLCQVQSHLLNVQEPLPFQVNHQPWYKQKHNLLHIVYLQDTSLSLSITMLFTNTPLSHHVHVDLENTSSSVNETSSLESNLGHSSSVSESDKLSSWIWAVTQVKWASVSIHSSPEQFPMMYVCCKTCGSSSCYVPLLLVFVLYSYWVFAAHAYM